MKISNNFKSHTYHSTKVVFTFSWSRSFIVFSNLLARFTLRYLTKGLMVIPYECRIKNRFSCITSSHYSKSKKHILIPGRRPWSKRRRLWPWRKAVASWPCFCRRAIPKRKLLLHAIHRKTWRTFQRDLIYANGNDWLTPSAWCNLEITKLLEKNKTKQKNGK